MVKRENPVVFILVGRRGFGIAWGTHAVIMVVIVMMMVITVVVSMAMIIVPMQSANKPRTGVLSWNKRMSIM
jgi:hypothetical protein